MAHVDKNQRGPEEVTKPSSTDDSRRRLLKGGLAGAPVLMTIVSRPALGQCLCPSAWGSGNLSQPGGGEQPCQGTSASNWANNAPETTKTNEKDAVTQSVAHGSWPPGYAPTQHFSTVFSKGGGVPENATLLQVLKGNNPVASNIVAALLNAASGRNKTPSVDVVKGIWSEYVTTGFFSPMAGVRWDGSQIIAYLQSTMPNP